jgi:hypothetical protein
VCLLKGTKESTEMQLPSQIARMRTGFGSRTPLIRNGDPGARRQNLDGQWTSHGKIQNARRRRQRTRSNLQRCTSCLEAELVCTAGRGKIEALASNKKHSNWNPEPTTGSAIPMRKSKPGVKSLTGTTRTEPFEDKMKGPASKTRSSPRAR